MMNSKTILEKLLSYYSGYLSIVASGILSVIPNN